MTTPSRVPLKDPWVAAVLAWLIPGLGHFYQGRLIKSGIYFVSITTLMFWGMYLGDGKVVTWTWSPTHKTWGYLAQVGAGLYSLPALLQRQRVVPEQREVERSRISLEAPLAGEFEGWLSDITGPPHGSEAIFEVRGRLELAPARGNLEDRREVRGTFLGEFELLSEPAAGIPQRGQTQLEVTFLQELEPTIFPSRDRELACTVHGKLTGEPGVAVDRATLNGRVKNVRSLWNRYCAPLDEEGLQNAHGDLGKFFELGLVYTWIAGLLNVLAIWDALEGPAYLDEEDLPPGGDLPEPPPGGSATPAQPPQK